MSEEKIKRPSAVRRTKKNGSRPQNREIRQSIHEVCENVDDLKLEQAEKRRPSRKVQRSKSLHRPSDLQPKIEEKTSREILKQYVANTHNIDVKTIDWQNCACAPNNTTDFPIHDVIEAGSIKDLAMFLLANEAADLEMKNAHGQTPLMLAVCVGDVEAVNLLIAFGVSVNTSDDAGVTALRYAVEAGDFDIASVLISQGANAETVQNGF